MREQMTRGSLESVGDRVISNSCVGVLLGCVASCMFFVCPCCVGVLLLACDATSAASRWWCGGDP